MPWSFSGAILFNKHSEVQMFIWISGPAETHFSRLAYPGAVLSLLDTKEHGRVARQEKNGDGEKGSGFSCSGSYTRDGSGNQRVSCLQMKQEPPHPRHAPTSIKNHWKITRKKLNNNHKKGHWFQNSVLGDPQRTLMATLLFRNTRSGLNFPLASPLRFLLLSW